MAGIEGVICSSGDGASNRILYGNWILPLVVLFRKSGVLLVLRVVVVRYVHHTHDATNPKLDMLLGQPPHTCCTVLYNNKLRYRETCASFC